MATRNRFEMIRPLISGGCRSASRCTQQSFPLRTCTWIPVSPLSPLLLCLQATRETCREEVEQSVKRFTDFIIEKQLWTSCSRQMNHRRRNTEKKEQKKIHSERAEKQKQGGALARKQSRPHVCTKRASTWIPRKGGSLLRLWALTHFRAHTHTDTECAEGFHYAAAHQVQHKNC